MARTTQEAGGCVLLTKVPTAGEMAQRAGDVLRADKEQQGIEPNDGFLQAPLLVKSLCLNKPERMEALGLVLVLALLRWRLVEAWKTKSSARALGSLAGRVRSTLTARKSRNEAPKNSIWRASVRLS